MVDPADNKWVGARTSPFSALCQPRLLDTLRNLQCGRQALLPPSRCRLCSSRAQTPAPWPPNPHPRYVRDLCTRNMPRVPAKTPMYDLLRLFQTGKSHMALLVKPPGLESRNRSSSSGRHAMREQGQGGGC